MINFVVFAMIEEVGMTTEYLNNQEVREVADFSCETGSEKWIHLG